MSEEKFRDRLCKAIRDESNGNGQGLQDALKAVIGSEITVFIGKSRVLTIVPYWAELYYSFKEDDKFIDPFCNHHPNKEKDGALFFKSFSYKEGHPWYRNRLDICLGKEKEEISILLKRARVCDGNGKQILSKDGGDYLTDYYIAKAVFDKLRCYLKKSDLTKDDFTCLSYSLKLRENPIEKLGLSRRVNLNKKKRDKWEQWDKEYACYDSSKFASDESCTRIKAVEEQKKAGGSL